MTAAGRGVMEKYGSNKDQVWAFTGGMGKCFYSGLTKGGRGIWGGCV